MADKEQTRLDENNHERIANNIRAGWHALLFATATWAQQAKTDYDRSADPLRSSGTKLSEWIAHTPRSSGRNAAE